MTRISIGHREYSTAFKLKVIEEVESGLSIREAQRRYKIGGKMTIDRWIRTLGNANLLPQSKGVTMSAETNHTIEQLKKEKAQLEAALSRVTIEKICLESLVEATEEHYGIDLKKNFGEQAQKKLKRKP
jgi:transposase-like protein